MAVKRPVKSQRELLEENKELRLALEEANETLRAIRSGEVDALVVTATDGQRIFTLQGADRAYRGLIEEMNEGALNLTGDGMILYANRRFAALLNEPLESVIGSSIQNWTTVESQPLLTGLLETGARGNCRGELTLAASGGRVVPVFLSVAPMEMEGLQGCLGVVVMDLTEQKQAEQALRVSETKFRNIFENASLGKVLLSMDGAVEANSALLSITGYSHQELQHLNWSEVVHPEDLQVVQNALNAVRDGRLPGARFELRGFRKGGSMIWADVTVGLVKDPAGNPVHVFISVYDITARKNADAALHDLKQHLQRYIEAERLHLAQDLHDVPLQELYGILYRLEELRPQSQPRNAEVISEVIADVKATLSSLRSIATELRPPAISKSGFEKAARSYIQAFREKHPALQVHAWLKRDDLRIPEDKRLMLLRVLQEAFSNIIRHARATEVKVRFDLDGQEACLEITDNGKGFPVPESWSAMVGEGHYGIAGMVERVQTIGGALTVTSKPGISTTVRVVLPYEPVKAKAAKKVSGARKPRR